MANIAGSELIFNGRLTPKSHNYPQFTAYTAFTAYGVFCCIFAYSSHGEIPHKIEGCSLYPLMVKIIWYSTA